MSATVAAGRRRAAGVLAETRKLSAFMRRDVFVMLSYRVAFLSDLVFIGVQAVVFSFLAKMVDPAQLPTYHGKVATYLEFVMIGVVISTVSSLLLQRVATAMRQEQMMGTLEALLTSPTSPATTQVGSIALDLLLIPARMGALLVLVALTFGLDFQVDGVLPGAVVFAAFVPFVWGLGLVAAASTLTFRRGGGLAAAGMSGIALVSGAFFPLALLPGWIQALAAVNPVAIALEGIRESLIGGAGWAEVGPDVLLLIPLSALAVAGGAVAFRAALAREHRHGTLGLY
jgi:ABC-2 type transport system permease protein